MSILFWRNCGTLICGVDLNLRDLAAVYAVLFAEDVEIRRRSISGRYCERSALHLLRLGDGAVRMRNERERGFRLIERGDLDRHAFLDRRYGKNCRHDDDVLVALHQRPECCLGAGAFSQFDIDLVG
jgi:hypothetical protein